MFDDNALGKKKKKEEADLDITPMIDVVFLLLIFFMVTSTMQGTPDKDIPPSISGTNANNAGFKDLSILAPQSSGADGELQLDGKTVTLDQLKAELIQMANLALEGQELKLMIYAERDVKSGFVGEVETVVGEVANDTGKEVLMNFAVKDKR